MRCAFLISAALACFFFGTEQAAAQTNTFPSTGSAGIGIAYPLAPLHIETAAGSGATELFRLSKASGYGTTTFKQFYTGPADYGLDINDTLFVINKGKKSIGIGFYDPDARLAIKNIAAYSYIPSSFLSGRTLDLISCGNNNSDYSGIRFSNPPGYRENFFGVVQNSVTGSGDFVFQGYSASLINYAELARITSEGMLGIGTNAPQSLVDIAATAPALSLRVKTNNNTAKIAFKSSAGYERGFIKADMNEGVAHTLTIGSRNSIQFENNGINTVTIWGSGNVSIGCVSSPTEKFSVEGNIRSKKIIVTQLGWCDYVFDNGYKLRSVSSLEQFIKQNKHLPEVPSAKEVADNGISVGDTQALLLKKIEELTLYMIKLKKENNRFQKTNESLQARIKNIEQKIKNH